MTEKSKNRSFSEYLNLKKSQLYENTKFSNNNKDFSLKIEKSKNVNFSNAYEDTITNNVSVSKNYHKERRSDTQHIIDYRKGKNTFNSNN